MLAKKTKERVQITNICNKRRNTNTDSINIKKIIANSMNNSISTNLITHMKCINPFNDTIF